MNVESHLDQLRTKHEELKTQIREEERRPGMNHLEVSTLKKKKLMVKEEIARLCASHH